MSLHTGYNQTEEKSDINMGEYRITQKTAATDPDHLVSKKYVDIYDGINRNFANTVYARKVDVVSPSDFKRDSINQSVFYKFSGFTKLNIKHLPDYEDKDYMGRAIIGADGYTDNSSFYLGSITLDRDSTDYAMKFKFYARLIYKDGTTETVDISNGGIELSTMTNIDVSVGDSPYTMRWISLGVKVNLKSIATKSIADLRVIMVLVEQIGGAVHGHEMVVQCEVREF